MKNLRNKQAIATNKQFQAQNLSDALLTKVAGGQGRPARPHPILMIPRAWHPAFVRLP